MRKRGWIGWLALAIGLTVLAGPAAAYDELAVEEKALRVVDALLPPDIETRKKSMGEAPVEGWVKAVFEAQSQRGWIPIELYIREGADYAFMGQMYQLDPSMDARDKARKAMENRLPPRFDRKLLQSGDTPLEGVKEFLFEVQVPQRGAQPVAAYVGDGFGVVGQLFGPDNQNLTEVAKQKWAGGQVSWKELVKGLKPVYGSEGAPVRFAMFTDPDCPACQQAKRRIDTLIEKHREDLSGYLLWFPLEMHKHARPKAEVLACSTPERQSRMFDALKGSEPGDVEDVYATLQEEGVEVPERVRECVSSGKGEEWLKRVREFANKMQVTSVPSVYYDGRLFKGFPEQEIREALRSGSGS
ncbi:thioredoxin domain-containing protein [Thiohalorhabdus methylotrophus]|uniref:Thioredoxin domain-containing protein n=1 Tax=Thiohalorhabdus methylotrophus TaxID=3242694 RepID=A0ABV4TYQ3_9GAMM